MGALDVFIDDVLPWIGNCTSAALFLTTLALISLIRRSNDVGAVNPLPFVMQFFQSQMWAMYVARCAAARRQRSVPTRITLRCAAPPTVR